MTAMPPQTKTNKRNGTGALSGVSGDAVARSTWPAMENLPGRASPDLRGSQSRLQPATKSQDLDQRNKTQI